MVTYSRLEYGYGDDKSSFEKDNVDLKVYLHASDRSLYHAHPILEIDHIAILVWEAWRKPIVLLPS